MRYFWRVFFVLLGVAVVSAAILVAMLVVSSYQGELYDGRVKIAFNAAVLNYAPGDPKSTVVTTCGGKSVEVDPDEYRALSFYLRLGASKAYWPPMMSGGSITITICASDELHVYRITDDKAYVVFTSGGNTMKMVIRGDGIWEDLTNSASCPASRCINSE